MAVQLQYAGWEELRHVYRNRHCHSHHHPADHPFLTGLRRFIRAASVQRGRVQIDYLRRRRFGWYGKLSGVAAITGAYRGLQLAENARIYSHDEVLSYIGLYPAPASV